METNAVSAAHQDIRSFQDERTWKRKAETEALRQSELVRDYRGQRQTYACIAARVNTRTGFFKN
jgi:hypothetical protein